ncbi:DNA polymerase-3 subunit epsilon [Salana multivorans]|uniref:DNA polymerase-3 subunit epsilon n=1 Tax=Salana multivorans TaxID=120377 RepID=A0A3N2DCC1_9MICO|nr:exonuclease domain-containing protein [Salana multivorans]MBN8881157.1 DNA polymerase III subunit epsilon [Salana multivorans]OJX97804.1 MAG: DNA polymerase III subunit epsilon [Micrococcales bacterium 73-15]ROR97403.1 DNA polymerase-3 subunit epsilon [Salana multivorans]
MDSSTGWTTRRIVGFDTETTGVDVRTDRIVTAALVIRAGIGGLSQVRTWLIDPGVEIPEAASAIHGVTTEHARAHGVQPREALEEIASLLAASMSADCPVVAYNACFDLTLLEYELDRHGLPTLTERIGRAPSPAIDPLVLDRALDRYRPGKRRLGDLASFYGVVASGELHAADVDVDATLDVLGALVRRFPELGELTLDALHDRQIRAHYRWASSFNDWLTSNGFEREPADLAWPLGGRYAPPTELLVALVERARRAAVARPVAYGA